MTTFAKFTELFFSKIEAYKDVRQDFDDLNSILKRRHEKPAHSTPVNKERPKFNQERHKGKRFIKREAMHAHDDSIHHMLDDDLDDEVMFDMPTPDLDEDDEEEYEIVFHHPKDTDAQEDEFHELNAVNVPKPGAIKEAPPPCWWKFMKGECTKEGCRLDHSERAMQELREKKMRELATAKFGPKTSDVLPTFTRYAKEKASEGPPKKT